MSFSVSSTSPLAVDAVTQLRCVTFSDIFHSELRKDKIATCSLLCFPSCRSKVSCYLPLDFGDFGKNLLNQTKSTTGPTPY